jgi:hypothetical protein
LFFDFFNFIVETHFNISLICFSDNFFHLGQIIHSNFSIKLIGSHHLDSKILSILISCLFLFKSFQLILNFSNCKIIFCFSFNKYFCLNFSANFSEQNHKLKLAVSTIIFNFSELLSKYSSKNSSFLLLLIELNFVNL